MLTAATAPLYLAVLLRRAIIVSRPAMNVVAVVGAVAVSGLVYAGGGLPSGFFLLALWFLPIVVCSLPGRDVALHAVLVAAGCAAASALSVHMGGPYNGHGSLWGLGVVALATLVVNTTLVAYLFGRMRATTDDFQRRSAQDPLTGLANRTALHDRLDAMDLRASRAVYVIDVDGFKFVNDSLGHHAGDRLLVLVATRLERHARHGDLLARPGGDEFVLVADGIRDDRTRRRGRRAPRRQLRAAVQPRRRGGRGVRHRRRLPRRPTAATGEEALRDADLALYAAKLERRGTVEAVRRADARRRQQPYRRSSATCAARSTATSCTSSTSRSSTSRDASIVGMEALLRWTTPTSARSPRRLHPDRRADRPDPPHRPLRPRPRRRAARARWQRRRPRRPHVASTSPPASSRDEQLLDHVAELLEPHGASAERLLLELTETALMRDTTGQPLHAARAPARDRRARSPSTTSAPATRRSPTSAASPSTR